MSFLYKRPTLIAVQVQLRDVREWLSTFCFPPIPTYSIPIPPISIPISVFYSHCYGIPMWAIPILSDFHSHFCVLFTFPSDFHGIPIPIGNPIPMHISRSNPYLSLRYVHSQESTSRQGSMTTNGLSYGRKPLVLYRIIMTNTLL